MKIRLYVHRKRFVNEITETMQSEKYPLFCKAQITEFEQKNFNAMLNRIRKKVMKRIWEVDNRCKGGKE